MLLAIAALVAGLAPCALAYSAEDMLSAPRPHAPVLHPSGDLVLHVVDHWDSKHDKMHRNISILSLPSGKVSHSISTVPAEASEVFWIEDDWAYLNGTTVQRGKDGEVVHRFPQGVEANSVEHARGQLVFVGQMWEGHQFEDTDRLDKEYEQRGDTGVVFDELFVRHWDTWRTPGKGWTVGIVHLHSGVYTDLFAEGTFGQRRPSDAPSYTIAKDLIAVTVKPTWLNPATHTATRVNIFSITGKWLFPLPTTKEHGALSSVVVDRDGDKIAWLAMAEDGYESDHNVVNVLHDARKVTLPDVMDGMPGFYNALGGLDKYNPQRLAWSLDSKSLYLIAEDEGRSVVFQRTLGDPSVLSHIDIPGTANYIQDTPHGLLVVASSMTYPSRVYLNGTAITSTPSLDYKPEKFWFEGAEREVMAWVINPGIKNAPLAFLIHGGPQGAWLDSWSTRWNPALFAAQGYFVVAVNPTGSTGYGQEFVDAIQYNWGSLPYKDLVAGYHAALSHYSKWIDPSRTAALGASYGGYMINWLQGHNPGFKAFVCHDGIFDTTTSYYTTEEVYFPNHDFGDPITNRAIYERWNPMNHVAEWKTPELIIHGGRDYRLVASQGIAVFTALRTRGVPSRFLYFADENHWITKPSNSIKWHHEVFKWLDEWVGEGPRAPWLWLQN